MLNPFTPTSLVTGTASGVVATLNENFGDILEAFDTICAEFVARKFGDLVITGLLPATDVSLTSNISIGSAIISGELVVLESPYQKTYTASKYVYVDIDKDGDFLFTDKNEEDVAPELAADSIRLAVVITDADNIIAVHDMRFLYPYYTKELNISGSTILKGTVVSFDATDEGIKPTVGSAYDFIGVALTDIPNNLEGYIVSFGQVDILLKNTEASVKGGWVYISDTAGRIIVSQTEISADVKKLIGFARNAVTGGTDQLAKVFIK